MPLEPEPQPGTASTNQTPSTTASTISTTTIQLRPGGRRTAPSISVDPDIHKGVLVEAELGDAGVESPLCPGVGRVRADTSPVAVLVDAVAPDVTVERPAEACVRRPAVAPEVGDLPVLPAPSDLLVVAKHHHPDEVLARRPRPPRPACAA